MKNDHTHLTRLAAISLVVVMCLSALPMLAPPAAAASDGGGTVILARATDHDALWQYEPTARIDPGSRANKVYEWNGSLITNIQGTIAASTDGGMTWQTMHQAAGMVTGIFVHQGAIYYTYNGHLMRSTDGVQWTEVLELGATQHGTSWSWDAVGDRIIFGTYSVPQSTETSAYLSSDNGVTWTRVFHIEGATATYHTHKVAIDPYDGWLYVNIGDNTDRRGLYVSKDLGATWDYLLAQGPLTSGAATPMNGFLACSYPDRGRVLWYADNLPEVWMLDKARMEMVKVVDMRGVMAELGVTSYEMWDVAFGQDLTYLMTRGSEQQKNFLFASADGIVWYLIQQVPYMSYPTISVADGRLYYSGGGSWRDVPMDEYLDSIATVWDVDEMTLPRGVPIVWPVSDYYNISVTQADPTNYVLNPSMEETADGEIVGWGNPSGSILPAPHTSDVARTGSTSLYIYEDWQSNEAYTSNYRIVEQKTNTYLEPGTYTLRFSVMSTAVLTEGTSSLPMFELWIDGVKHQFRHSIPVANKWIDCVYEFTTAGGTLTDVKWFTYNSTAWYRLDRVSISEHPYYSLADAWDPLGSPLSINGQPVEEGVVHLQAGDTIMLTKGYATVSFGEADASDLRTTALGQYAWLIVGAAGVVGLVVYAVALRHPLVLIVGIGLLLIAALLKTGVL
jgi:photosystem II stability/assembly factor-like uncharacterized protein